MQSSIKSQSAVRAFGIELSGAIWCRDQWGGAQSRHA